MDLVPGIENTLLYNVAIFSRFLLLFTYKTSKKYLGLFYFIKCIEVVFQKLVFKIHIICKGNSITVNFIN